MAAKQNQKWLNYFVSISVINDDSESNLHTSFIKVFNYHGNQRKHVRLDRNFCLFTKRNKIIQKIKWFLLIKKDYLLAIRGKGLHFCIMELGSDRIVQIICDLRANL